MSSRSTPTILRYLTEELSLDVRELLDVRDAIEAHLCHRIGIAPGSRPRRTLYLRAEPMNDL
jgi:hypothetical protein